LISPSGSPTIALWESGSGIAEGVLAELARWSEQCAALKEAEEMSGDGSKPGEKAKRPAPPPPKGRVAPPPPPKANRKGGLPPLSKGIAGKTRKGPPLPPPPAASPPSAPEPDPDPGLGEALVALCEQELATDPDPVRAVQLHLQIGWVHEHMLGDVSAAGGSYQKALQIDGDHLSAIRATRRARLATGNVSDALELFDAEIRLAGTPQEAAGLAYEKAFWLEQAGDTYLARETYRTAVELDPRHAPALKALERLASVELRFDELASVYEESANTIADPAHRAALIAQRASLVEAEAVSPELSAELYEAALALDGRAVGCLRALERIYHSEGRFGDLLRVLERRAEQTADPVVKAAVLSNVARVYAERLGKVPEAVAALERARSEAPRDPLILEELAALYERANRRDALPEVLVVLADLAPDTQSRVVVHHRLGQLYEHELDRPEDAIRSYSAALALAPTHLPSLQAVEGLLRERKSFSELVSIWRAEADAATDDGRRARAHVRIAQLADTELNDADLAVEHYERAVTFDPQDEPSFRALTRLYAQAGRLRDLVEVYEQAINRTSSVDHEISYLFRIGSIFEDELDDPVQAAMTYRRILKSNPDHMGAIHALARAAERAQRYRDAAEAIAMEAERTTDERQRAALLVRLGLIEADLLGDAQSAAIHLRQALEIEPHNETALSNLGRLHHAAGRWADLLDTYRLQAEGTPGGLARAELLFKMGEIAEHRLKSLDRAIECYREAIDVAAGHDPAFRALSRLLLERGAFAELADVMTSQVAAIREPEGRAQAHYRAGQVHEERLADVESAIRCYQAALDEHGEYRPAREALVRLRDSHGDWEFLVDLLAEEAAADDERGAAALLRRAEIYRDRLGDRDSAISSLEALLGRPSGELVALLALEPLHVANGNSGALAELYARESTSLQDEQARLAALKELVRMQFAEGAEHEASHATLGRIVEIAPDDPYALGLLEHIALERGDADLRARLDGRIAALATDECVAADHLASLALHHERAGRLPEAAESYRGALARHAEHLPAIAGLGRVAASLQDHETLAEAKHRAAEFTSQPERAATLLVEEADLRITRLGDPDAGTRLLEQALRACPDHEPAARRTTEHLTSQGLFERLVEILSRAANAAEDPARINHLWATVGTVYGQQLGNVRSAITALERAGKALPDDTGTLVQVADLYMANEQWNDAAEVLGNVVSLSLDDETLVAAHLKLADLWSRRLDDMAKASEHLDSVLTVDPEHPQALAVLAEIQRKSGDLDLALETATRLAESTQGAARAAALVRIAIIEQDRGNRVAFVDSLCAAVRLEGAGGEGSKLLRRVATDVPLGKAYSDALGDFIKSPGGAADVESYIELGRVLSAVMEMPQTAVGTLARGLEATGGESAIAVELARLLEAGGQHEEAAGYLSQALVKNATDADLWRAYAAVLARGNRKLEARLALAPIEALGRASEQERAAGQEARSQLAAPAAGVFGPQTLSMLADGAMSNTAMSLLDALLDPIAKLLAPDLASFGLSKRDRLPPKSMDSLRVLVDDVASSFGSPELELYASESAGQAAQILSTSPPTLVLSRQVENMAEREQAFVVARGLAAIAGRFYPAVSLSPEHLAQLFAAAGHGVDPGFGTDVASAEELEQTAQQLRKAFSWLSSRKPFDKAVAAYVEAPVGDFARWVRKLEATAVCAAALVVADVPAAVRVMRREAGDSAASGDPVGFLRGHPVALKVLQFWGSGNAFRVWRKVGMLR